MPDLHLKLSISPELPGDYYHKLILVLKSVPEADVKEPTMRPLGPEWVDVFVILKDIAVATGAVNAVVKLAEKINEWRKNAKAKNLNTDIIVTRNSNGSPLNLRNASDDEVREWLSKIDR